MLLHDTRWTKLMLRGQCKWQVWHRESGASALNYWWQLPSERGTAAPGCGEREVGANTGSERQLASCAPSTYSSLQTGSPRTELVLAPRPPDCGAALPSPTARSLSMPWSSASSAALGTFLRSPPSPGRWTQSPRSGRFSSSRCATCWTCWARRPSAAERGCTRPHNRGFLAGAGWEATHLESAPNRPPCCLYPLPLTGRNIGRGTRSCSF